MKESSNQSRYDKGLALVADSNDIIFRFNSSRTCYQPFVIIYINNSCEQCHCPHPCKHCCRGPIGPTGPTVKWEQEDHKVILVAQRVQPD